MEALSVKQEKLAFCQCCLSEGECDGEINLRLITFDQLVDASRPGTYSDLLIACFSIQLTNNGLWEGNQCYICETCIERLKESFSFRCQIEDCQTKLKHVYSKFADDADIKQDSKTSIFKSEITSDEDINPDFECVDIPDIGVKKKTNKIIIRSKRVSKKNSISKVQISDKDQNSKEEEDLEITPENAYDVAIQNLLDKDNSNPERKRNKVKLMSTNDFRKYRRLYYRIRYAKAIPFKLDETAVSCDLCGERFNTHKNLVSHMAIHYPNHICDLCGKSFVLKEQLAGHMRTHNNDKRTCQVCKKVLKKSSMTRHMRTHTGNNEVYACPSCPRRFVSFSTRINHMAEAHKVDILKYSCSICAKKFHLSSSLTKHVRRCHFQELNVSCPDCGKGFFDNKSLKNHMLKHTGEKKFQCEICLKSYGRKCTIREHMKIHDNIKQYKCHICEREFTQKCTLKGHLKVHERLITVKSNEC